MLRVLIKTYMNGRLHGLPRCCCVRFALDLARNKPPGPARREVGRATEGRVPCEVHLLLGGWWPPD